MSPYLAKFGQQEEEAVAAGYNVGADGVLRSPSGGVVKGYSSCKRHLRFRYRKNGPLLFVHRLAAFQLWGRLIYTPGICIRHRDGNHTNNRPDNLELGSHHENMMDIPKEVRVKRSSEAGLKHDHARIRELHRLGMSYKGIMAVTGITSLGTVSFIVRKSMAAKTRVEVAV